MKTNVRSIDTPSITASGVVAARFFAVQECRECPQILGSMAAPMGRPLQQRKYVVQRVPCKTNQDEGGHGKDGGSKDVFV